ncbi:MAG: ComF family protein [Bacillaceae bacterium]|nr:ComF family protein [Bacillaceae bacterium]
MGLISRLMTGLLFPERSSCRLCDKTADRASTWRLCRTCYQDLQWLGEQICDVCGRRLDSGSVTGQNTGGSCSDCVRRSRENTFFVTSRSAVGYNDKMKEILGLYKYRGKESLEPFLIDLLFHAFQRYYREIPFDKITYVPLHPQKQRERGFNQTERFATALSERISIPAVPLLIRRKQTEMQSQKSRRQRIKSLRHVFAGQPLHRHFAGVSQEGQDVRRVLLLDDVYTTGSTANECARVLQAGGVGEVYVLTVAR